MRKLLNLSLFLLLFITSSFFLRRHLYTFRFADEAEVILGGKLITKGETPYQDYWFEHQPLAYYASAFIQQRAKPQNLRETIKIHRLVLLGWQFFWAGIMLAISPWVTLLFLLIWQIAGFELFSSLFLLESITVYPLCFTLLILWFVGQNQRPGFLLRFLTASALWILWLTQQTLWLYLVGWLAFFIYFERGRLMLYFKPLIFATLLISPVFFAIPLTFWYQTVIVANARDCVYVVGNCSLLQSLQNGLFFPFQILFTSGSGGFLLFEKLLMVMYLCTEAILLRKKNTRLWAFGSFVLGVTLALRPLTSGATLYTGFHALPFFTISTVIVFINTREIWHKRWLSAGFFGILLTSLLLAKPYLLQKVNPEEQYTIYYQPVEEVAEKINSVASEKDTLFVFPDQMWVYYLAKPGHASRFIYFYEWMWQQETYRSQLRQLFITTPPDVVYAQTSGRGVLDEQKAGLLKNYEPVKIGVDNTSLFLYQDKSSK